jgi:uncharacterized heparinase superfamily protein
MYKVLLFINTVKYLKWQQVYFRLVRKFIKPKVTDKFNGSIPKRSAAWETLKLYEEKIDLHLNVSFLNQSKQLDLPADWNNEDFSKLWVYNLHYFEDLLSDNADKKSKFHLQLLSTWVDQNPLGYGNGWEPYPMSLRIVNILKAWLGGLEIDEKLFKSVHSQVSYLSSDLEKHLLGNHYFVNLKALLFGGIIFGNLRWVKVAEKGLLLEVCEQVLDDGANFELTPMYHSLILVDMLDLFNLSRAYPDQVSRALISLLEENIPKMLTFMEAMAHPDEGVSFFNDSANGIAPTKVKIASYAETLGFKFSGLDSNKVQLIDNLSSGYISAMCNGNKLIFDASPVGSSYIPAHAHADALSFEFSIGTQRVFVNSGTSEYGLSKIRQYQRKTKAHNTVEVDGKDSSQVWSGFRVAKRACIIDRFCEVDCDENIRLRASHDGYKSLFFGGCVHSRNLTLTDNSLVVEDSLIGSFSCAKSRFYFHPDLSVQLNDDVLTVLSAEFILTCDLTGCKSSITESFWYPQFGFSLGNKVLEIDFKASKLELSFEWTTPEDLEIEIG